MNQAPTSPNIYLDTPVKQLFENGLIDRIILRACQSAKPPMETAGDIAAHLARNGNFSTVPGCRRPGRIPNALTRIAESVIPINTPGEMQHTRRKRQQAEQLDREADFAFLTDEQRSDVLAYRQEHNHLPMFRILAYYLNRADATRNDTIMAYMLNFDTDASAQQRSSLASIASEVNLSRERVRQIALTYSFPEILMLPSLWTAYSDHSTYFVAPNHPKFIEVANSEVPGLSFEAYAYILHRTTMLQNMDDKYLARRGWTNEIMAWVNRINKLIAMPRTIDNHISIEGLAMGGNLDTRIKLIVINQIAPGLGIHTDGNGALILPKNT